MTIDELICRPDPKNSPQRVWGLIVRSDPDVIATTKILDELGWRKGTFQFDTQGREAYNKYEDAWCYARDRLFDARPDLKEVLVKMGDA